MGRDIKYTEQEEVDKKERNVEEVEVHKDEETVEDRAEGQELDCHHENVGQEEGEELYHTKVKTGG